MSDSQPPTEAHVRQAAHVVARYLKETPLYRSAALSRPGHDVFIKLESASEIGSFKARGAVAYMYGLDPDGRRRGVVTASTGNHGQGVAFAGRVFGVPVEVFCPRHTTPDKSRAMSALGATVTKVGDQISDAIEAGRARAGATGRIFLEDGDDPWLMAGASTVAAEVLDRLPGASRFVVPVGGGNLIAATTLAVRRRRAAAEVVGVQSEASPAAYESWRSGRVVRAESRTTAGGLENVYPGQLAFNVLNGHVSAFHLVSERDLDQAVPRVHRLTGQVAERAGAAPFAALWRFGADWRGTTVLLLTGRNIEPDDRARLLADNEEDRHV
jgi:threonine dehydratase